MPVIPDPEPGLVIHYEFLWSHEDRRGLQDGVKRRAAIVVAVLQEGNNKRILVAPITTARPIDPNSVIPMPQKVRENLGLNAPESWVVVDELNSFVWPGSDLYPLPFGARNNFSYGTVPLKFLEQINTRLIEIGSSNHKIIMRD
jgi:hypothetical protein